MDYFRSFPDKSAGAVTADTSPDPLTYKAFLSEFKAGEKTGAELAWGRSDAPGHLTDGPSLPAQISVAEDKVAEAARDLLDLAKRIETLSGQGNLAVNETRLAAKMSGILSSLFYNAGLTKGLKG